MKRGLAIFMGAILFVTPNGSKGQSFCQQVLGAVIVATDGTFLGTVTSEYDSDSIFNEYGTYGSKYSSESMLNEYSEYGSEYSDILPFNDYASKLPLLILDGIAVARITTNNSLEGAVSPYAIFACQ